MLCHAPSGLLNSLVLSHRDNFSRKMKSFVTEGRDTFWHLTRAGGIRCTVMVIAILLSTPFLLAGSIFLTAKKLISRQARPTRNRGVRLDAILAVYVSVSVFVSCGIYVCLRLMQPTSKVDDRCSIRQCLNPGLRLDHPGCPAGEEAWTVAC